MYTKSDYFVTKDFHEDKCLRKAANHFEVSEQIYLKREHYSGRAYCLKALGNLRQKLNQNYIKIMQEYRKMQKIVITRTRDSSFEPVKGLNPWIERDTGNDVSVMIEIIDSDQIKWSNTGLKDTRQSLHPKSIINSGSKSPKNQKKGSDIKTEPVDGMDSRRKHQPKR